MKFKYTLLAIAVMAMSSPAFANDESSNNSNNQESQVVCVQLENTNNCAVEPQTEANGSTPAQQEFVVQDSSINEYAFEEASEYDVLTQSELEDTSGASHTLHEIVSGGGPGPDSNWSPIDTTDFGYAVGEAIGDLIDTVKGWFD